jgi:hypothetical protein
MVSPKDEIPELPKGCSFYGDLSFQAGNGKLLFPISFTP